MSPSNLVTLVRHFRHGIKTKWSSYVYITRIEWNAIYTLIKSCIIQNTGPLNHSIKLLLIMVCNFVSQDKTHLNFCLFLISCSSLLHTFHVPKMEKLEAAIFTNDIVTFMRRVRPATSHHVTAFLLFLRSAASSALSVSPISRCLIAEFLAPGSIFSTLVAYTSTFLNIFSGVVVFVISDSVTTNLDNNFPC